MMLTMINRAFLTWFTLGALWNAVNLWLLFLVIKTTFSQTKKISRIVLLLFLKFPLLYTSGYILLAYGNPSMGGLILGLTLTLLSASFWMIVKLIRPAQSGYDKENLVEGTMHSAVLRNIKGK